MNWIDRFLKDESGLTTVEYAVAGGVLTLGTVGLFTELGQTVVASINRIVDLL